MKPNNTDIPFLFGAVQAKLSEQFGKKPDLEAILFLIGLQEYGGDIERPIKKETKQDLMHIAVCNLFIEDGYFKFTGLDADGWPHYDHVQPLPFKTGAEQEAAIQEKVVLYFQRNGLLDL